jgi:hypothetical protein
MLKWRLHPSLMMRVSVTPGSALLFAVLIVGLVFCLLVSGCLTSPSTGTQIEVNILEKSMSPADLGECSYQTLMRVTNNGTTDIQELSIRVELYDPEAQKIAAWEVVPIGDLRSGRATNATSTLQTHCRMTYTLRAYAQY